MVYSQHALVIGISDHLEVGSQKHVGNVRPTCFLIFKKCPQLICTKEIIVALGNSHVLVNYFIIICQT